MAMYNQTNAYLAPYRNVGNYAAGQLQNRLADLTSPITMDQVTLENTPGYKFNLSQGLRAAQSSAAARGLGLSGAAIKGATDYATGLADSTYQNQFNNANTNQTNAYNRLYQTAALGQSAAAGTGAAALTTGQGIANNTIGAGNAQGAASIAAGNALGSGSNALLNLLASKLNGTSSPSGLYGTPNLLQGDESDWT
jgi:hypothetical protein